MTYISKQFTEPCVLPDGSFAYSTAEVDAYLKKTGLAHASDYSKQYVQNRKNALQSECKKDLFKAFLTNYKRMIFK